MKCYKMPLLFSLLGCSLQAISATEMGIEKNKTVLPIKTSFAQQMTEQLGWSVDPKETQQYSAALNALSPEGQISVKKLLFILRAEGGSGDGDLASRRSTLYSVATVPENNRSWFDEMVQRYAVSKKWRLGPSEDILFLVRQLAECTSVGPHPKPLLSESNSQEWITNMMVSFSEKLDSANIFARAINALSFMATETFLSPVFLWKFQEKVDQELAKNPQLDSLQDLQSFLGEIKKESEDSSHDPQIPSNIKINPRGRR